MEPLSLSDLAGDHLARAREGSAGRSAHTLVGGAEHHLRQTLIALLAGQGLDEHESPGDATLQVISGRVRLQAGDEALDLAAGQLAAIPPTRHALSAHEDSVVLLTVAKSLGHGD